ncbi:hypothetical protein [Nocardia aurantia]|uniref:Uncharacterized protein n=1 Tax=Nocardia aurantia TaxID=2585199 RepID=A0A7K0DRX7_9NOCA|nr:hypothetical protein [Nocardia aurantia]MQY28358.1 hypothetical protein [Nocardia aurantia]
MTVEHDRTHDEHTPGKFPHDDTEHEILDAEVDPETERAQHDRADEVEENEFSPKYQGTDDAEAETLGERKPVSEGEAGNHGLESASAVEDPDDEFRPAADRDFGTEPAADEERLESDSRGADHEPEAADSAGEYAPGSENRVIEPETGLPEAKDEDAVADTETEPALGSDPGVVSERLEANGFGTSEQQAVPGSVGSDSDALFASTDVEGLRSRFREAQGNFVDDPHDAVVKADELVTETIEQLTTALADRKRALEGRWSRDTGGGDVTEDLRQALRSYRTFLDQLLAVGK